MENLRLLELSDKERSIIEIILAKGLIGATDLAELAHLKRGSIYLYLENLKQKGLIIEIEKDNISYYRSVSFRQLESLIQTKINQLKSLKKNLSVKLKRANSPKNNPPGQISVYKGTPGLNIILEDISQNSEDTYLLGSARVFYKFMKDDPWGKRYNKKRRLKIAGMDYMITDWADKTVKSFYQDSDLFLKRRFLPEDFNINGGFAIYEDKIAIGVFTKEVQMVVIEEPTLAQLFKHMFQLFFKDLEGKNIPPKP